MKGVVVIAALFAMSACRSRSSAPSAKPEASRSPSPAPSASVTFAAPLAPPELGSARPPAPSLDTASRAALARARKLQADGQVEQAKAEFLRASGAGQTVHLQPLVELGYLQLTHLGESDEEAERLLLAGTASDDAALEAQAWFNLATLFERRSDSEAERAALARSLARRENKTVRAKLGARSACVGEVGKRRASSTPTNVSGWPGVCVQLQRCESSDISSAEARRSACLESSYSAADPDKSHGCPGAGPWTSTFEYSWFSYNRGWIAPTGTSRFFVDLARVGAWPATCRGAVTPEWKQDGAFAVVTLEDDELMQLPGRPIPQAEPENGVCISGAGTTTVAVYEAESAALLAAVSFSARQRVEVRFDATQRRLALSGGGCDGYVPADGSFRFLPRE
ncbi:MAG: hypothetical protein K0R38_259 [Polyangiaceae bacterium]|nr:hypothetical protein [Polyangiaceae bacterium]